MRLRPSGRRTIAFTGAKPASEAPLVKGPVQGMGGLAAMS